MYIVNDCLRVMRAIKNSLHKFIIDSIIVIGTFGVVMLDQENPTLTKALKVKVSATLKQLNSSRIMLVLERLWASTPGLSMMFIQERMGT